MIIPAHAVKAGDRVRAKFAAIEVDSHGAVDMVTEEGNYVRIRWTGVKRPDILSKQSPLWRLLELENGL